MICSACYDAVFDSDHDADDAAADGGDDDGPGRLTETRCAGMDAVRRGQAATTVQCMTAACTPIPVTKTMT
eukprot:10040915-Karenia_brevis.AAC.1